MMANTTRLNALFACAVMLFLIGCSDKQPAQDYAVTGTLTVPAQMQGRVEEYVRRGLEFELVMTARTGPKTSEILIQRRWAHVEMPFEFGLGKSRGTLLKSKADAVYITAMLTCKSPSFPLAACGFTTNPVPIGTYHIKLALDCDPNADETYLRPGAPIGGWSSLSAMEEARPPAKDQGPIGAMAFAGDIIVPDDLNRSFEGWKLQIIARERENRGAPELILAIPSPTFPLTFSLHQNHRIMGGSEPILDPKYIVVFLDKDGVTETEEDRVVVGTAEQVAVGTGDLVFKLPGKKLREILTVTNGAKSASGATSRSTASGNATSRPTSQPSKTIRPTAMGELVAEGAVTLPTELTSAAAGATLWISFRDAQSNKPLMFHKATKLVFPYEFSIHNGEGEMNMTVPSGSAIVVKAILTPSGDAMDKNALVGFSSPTKMGAKGLKIELKRP
ncbi:MAG: hypothetical protein ACI97A_001701 [Planctomycetota bacterium]|jgi:hypothetical protein